MKTIKINQQLLNDFDRSAELEWLETNGVGGWASATVVGAHTRRYHGLLVAATTPPVGRMVMVSKLEETVDSGGVRFDLSVNEFPGENGESIKHPVGNQFLERFERGLFPTWEFSFGGFRIRKTVFAVYGENTTSVIYEVLKAPQEAVLELRPFIAARDYHGLTNRNDFIRPTGILSREVLTYRAYSGVPDIYLSATDAVYHSKPDWYLSYFYREEAKRGLDAFEDLFTPGVFAVSIETGSKVGFVASTENAYRGLEAFSQLQSEKKRRAGILRKAGRLGTEQPALVLAADQFIVRRGENSRTIIAGYHWFTDWGRDTMIALPGLTLSTGRVKEAREILKEFLQSLSQGMLPNNFSDGGGEPGYNTVDATLWLFVALYKYWKASGDLSFIKKEALSPLMDIVDWHQRGTRFGIRVDKDGLLTAGEPGVQLTWMDAKVGDWVVTPRTGKPVEINALWYNALQILSELCLEAGRKKEGAEYAKTARKVKKSFQDKYWNAETGALYDVLTDSVNDASIRPNQIFALSLPFPLLSKDRAKSVIKVVAERLLTPFGLRSLDSSHPDYRGSYEGDQLSRDGAYHQGTVWSWLLGPYITALVRYEGPKGKRQAREIISGLMPHLENAGLGTISEIFDGDPPHTPRGCISQAWSVAEVLRVIDEEL